MRLLGMHTSLGSSEVGAKVLLGLVPCFFFAPFFLFFFPHPKYLALVANNFIFFLTNFHILY
jgi:hypothetical protein